MKPWVLFCEAPADFATASGLIDRVLRECGQAWVREQLDHEPESVRAWFKDGDRHFWDLHDIARHGRERRVGFPQGHFGGEAGAAGAAMARNVHLLARALTREEPIEALVLVWDADLQAEERRKGLAQAAAVGDWGFARVLALAVKSREAWVLAGFVPTADEETIVQTWRERTGHSPIERAHELSSKRESKDALRDLTAGQLEREERCWTETSLDTLRRRGEHSGLARFFADVEATLLPLVTRAS